MEMTLRTGYQNKQLHSHLNELCIDDETKQELVYSFTNGRTSSSAEMYYLECQNMINAMWQRVVEKKHKGSAQAQLDAKVTQWQNDAAQKMRRKILSICYEMKWTFFDDSAQKNKVDFKRLNAWILKYGHAKHNTLNNYTNDELPKLITQFEQVQRQYYKDLIT